MTDIVILPPGPPSVRFNDSTRKDLSTRLRCAALNKRILRWLDIILVDWMPGGKRGCHSDSFFVAPDPHYPPSDPRMIYVDTRRAWHSARTMLAPDRLARDTIVELASYLFNLSPGDAMERVESLLESVKPGKALPSRKSSV